MAREGEETLEVKGFGMEGKATGRRLFTDNLIVLCIGGTLAFGVYRHHSSNEEALTRLFEAMAENTYVLSLPQAERERLNIAMPESLRRKVRSNRE